MKRTVFSPSRLFKGSLALLLTLAFILPSLLVFPLALGDTENSEGSLEHTKLYNVVNSSNKKYYQHSDIRMSYDTNYASYLRTFLLMNTTSTANASPKSGWSAEKAKDANYMVAYCADWRTGSITNSFDSGKATYDTLTLDNSRILNSPNAAAIEGIINHAYPFITKAQMDAQLESAGLTKGSEADYIAAAQVAIWTLFTMDFPSYSFKYYGFSSIDQSDDLNPLSKRSSGMSNTNLKKIVNWLVKQRAPEDLAVSSYTNTEDGILTPNGDGTYTATVTVTLNRALRDGESVSASLVVGRRSGERVTANKNANTLTLTLSDLEYDEVRQNGLFVDLTASGKKISVYFFDSDYYQDMVSGKAENYTRNLSFSVTRGNGKSVSVTKVWENGSVPKKSVNVHLLANGVDTGRSVTLSQENDWAHLWTDLPSQNAYGEELNYTVYEDPVDGHYSVVSKVSKAPQTHKEWQRVNGDTLASTGDYMFVSSQGAMGWRTDKRLSRPSISFETAFTQDANQTPKNAIWRASDLSGKGAIFTSVTGSTVKLGLGTATKTLLATTDVASHLRIYIDGGRMYAVKNSTSYYFDFVHEYDADESNLSGKAATTGKDGAEIFQLYKLVDATYDASLDYVIHNYPLNDQAEPTTVEIKKTWSGKPDGTYPESCVVTLLQNGLPCKDPVTLSADNNWTATFTDLPTKDGTGAPITYSAKEDYIVFYTPTVSTETKNGKVTVNVENEYTPELLRAKIAKTDTDDLTLRFENIPFSIWLMDENGGGSAIPGTDKFGYRTALVTTGTTLEAAIDLAVGGTYYIIEESAPFGYSDPEEPIIVSVTRSGLGPVWTLLSGAAVLENTESGDPLLLAQNDAGYVLPETGGIGTAPFYTVGIALITLCCVPLWLRKKQTNQTES